MHYEKLKILIKEIASRAIQQVVCINDSCSPRPCVNTRYFKAEMPAAGVGALTFRPGAYAMAMGLSVLPAAAIGPAVVKVESASVNLRTI